MARINGVTVQPKEKFVLHVINPLCVGFGRPRPDHVAVLKYAPHNSEVSSQQRPIVIYSPTCSTLKRYHHSERLVGLAYGSGYVSRKG